MFNRGIYAELDGTNAELRGLRLCLSYHTLYYFVNIAFYGIINLAVDNY